MKTKPKVLIIGAGIGGLTAAIALRQAGFGVQVFERAAELKEIGAGIGLSANAIRVLKHLVLMQQVVSRGAIIAAAVSYTSKGRILSSLPTDLTDVPTICLHRAELQQALFSSLPSDCVHLGQEFVHFQNTSDGVTAYFASGKTTSGDVLVGADGLRSKVRAQLVGDGEPVYRGYQCWRGVCNLPASELLTETLGPGLRVGVVPIGRRGTAWWCTANEAKLADDGPNGAKAKLLRWFGDWHQPIPDVIRATDPTTVIKTGIYDRRPVKKWSQGCCTLLGDAAHPTTPNMGQGGCMAIEDSAVLARCLSNYSDFAMALRVYERLRYARTTKVTRISRYYGVIGQWKTPATVWFRNILLRTGSGKAATKSYLNFVSYDPYKVPLKNREARA
jgi:2-polyprenyl-6-methoxyphenol hydroxylase-like FAD-dependent oxidoreductase